MSTSFEIHQNKINLHGEHSLQALENWSELYNDTKNGHLTIDRDGDKIQLSVSDQTGKKELEIKIPTIDLTHSYESIDESWRWSTQDSSKNFEVKIKANTTDGNQVSLHLKVQHYSEDSLEWSKTSEFKLE